MLISVEITDQARPALKRLQLALSSDEFRGEVGQSVAATVRSHLAGLPPNEPGFPSTGFWQRAALATKSAVLPDGVSITIDQVGVRQRYLGGPIDPLRGQYLTIPATAETYGHTAAEFGNLKMVHALSPFGRGGGALALAPADARAGAGGLVDSSLVYFWLVRHVSQKPNSNVLPSDDELADAALDGALNFLSKLTGGTNR